MLHGFPWASCLTTSFTALARGKCLNFTPFGAKQRGKREECYKHFIHTLIHFLQIAYSFFSKNIRNDDHILEQSYEMTDLDFTSK